jgi:alkylhydroperoxidase family enzyme
MSREEVLAVAEKDTSGMDGTTAALVNYAFEFVDEYGVVSDERYDALREHYDRSTVVGVTMLAGYYVFLHHVATALGLELEEEFVGWELEHY